MGGKMPSSLFGNPKSKDDLGQSSEWHVFFSWKAKAVTTMSSPIPIRQRNFQKNWKDLSFKTPHVLL
ncbi:Uncharacterized protein TCM_038828 [Theobroma cacao]|uniref:Uncharacterized protein n=1 Tax=Theobroma cacao TaxID=3641 RepID=A0A061GQR2_THECC|nr:Uncharacterized protein TCM_038828 [Theobroma cacao]